MDFGNLQTDSMYPRSLTDIFKGTQLTIIGRYKNSSDIDNLTLRLSGKAGRENRTFNYTNLDFPLRNEKNDFLPRLWATRRVGWLIEQIRTNGDNKELRDEIVDLGTRYGIVTPYTSYLATDGSERQNQVMSRSVDSASMDRKVPMPTTGQGAVTASKSVREKKESLSIKDEEDSSVIAIQQKTLRKIGTKTFYLENGVWIDSEFKEESKLTEIKLQFASNEFFDLITKEKDLAQYFSLGEKVVVVWKGKVYRIS